MLLTTADVARFDNKSELVSYNQSLQIIDADEPWPPRWYTCPPYYTKEMFNQITAKKQYRYDMTIDAKVESGYLSFYKILSQQNMGVGQLHAPDFAGYILLNSKYEAIDTVISKEPGFNMYFHDLRLGKGNERMVDMKKNIKLDLRKYANEERFKAVNCNVDYIQILDTNNNVVFSWDPLKNLNPSVFRFKETLKGRAFASRHADLIEWTRLTSALWDYDGNILYAMKEIGIGKISRLDGHIIWQINYSDLPIISENDTLDWVQPHDFNLLSETDSSVIYSLFSNGEGLKKAKGVIFEMIKKTQKVKLVKYINPKTIFKCDGQGNLSYLTNGDYAIGYGFFETSDTISGYRSVLEYQKTNGSFGVYQLPQWNYTYKAHILTNWNKPPRPTILKTKDSLYVKEDTQDLTWYKLYGEGNMSIKKVGQGKSIKFEKNASYCVEKKYGIGYSVSKLFKIE